MPGPHRQASLLTPGFGNPIELSIPDGVSTVRGVGFPRLRRGVTVLVTNAPNRARSMTGAYSRPNPDVPDAVITGFLMVSPSPWAGRQYLWQVICRYNPIATARS